MILNFMVLYKFTIQKYLEKYVIFEISVKIDIFLLRMKIFSPFFYFIVKCM